MWDYNLVNILMNIGKAYELWQGIKPNILTCLAIQFLHHYRRNNVLSFAVILGVIFYML